MRIFLLFAAAALWAQDCGHSPIEPISTEAAAPPTRELFPIFGGAQERIGFIDSAGRVVVAPRLIKIGGAVTDGLMAVTDASDSESYIDSHGATRLKAPGTLAGPFSEGLAAVKIGDRFGYINKSGAVVIPPAFQVAGAFHLGLAAVRQGGRHGYIDTNGRMVISPTFNWAGEFSEKEGLAAVDYCGQCGYINRDGEPAFEQRFWRCYRFAGGVAKVEITQGKFGFVTLRGEVLGISDWPDGFLSEGLLAVKSPNGRIGFMDINGKWTIDPTFDAVAPFSEGKAAVELNGHWGFIDTSGKMVIPPAFGAPADLLAARFHSGLAFMADAKSDQYGFIDTSGKWVIPPRFERCQEQYGYHCGFHGALARVETRTHILYINKSGKPVWTHSVGTK